MASLKDIRGRIASVTNTQSITRAMKMVSAAKLRKAQLHIQNLSPYAKKLLEVIADVAQAHRVEHALLKPVPRPQKILLVTVTSDRGLCGGFNNNINRHVEAWHETHKLKYKKIDFLFVGRRGAEYFKSRHYPEPKKVILNLAREVSYSMAAEVAEQLMHEFAAGDYDEIRLVYNEFKSVIAQELVVETLLPVDASQSSFTKKSNSGAASQAGAAESSLVAKDLIFEPAPQQMVGELLKKHFSVQVFRVMSESVAAEHAARMNAMENATNNAKDMISSLTLEYNKLRQAAITTELSEICGGAEALKA